jgi:hypothetical protein
MRPVSLVSRLATVWELRTERADADVSDPAWELRRAAQMAAVMWTAGGMLGLLVLVLPREPGFPRYTVGVLIPGLLALLYGPILYVLAGRITLWMHRTNTILGIGLIGTAAYSAGALSLGIATLFVWAGMFAFLFFSRREAVAYNALIAVVWGLVAYASADYGEATLSRWLLIVASVVVTGVLVSWLIERRQAAEHALREARAEVRQLRIEIDEARAASKVAEITETEYFRDLERRAAELRLGRSS